MDCELMRVLGLHLLDRHIVLRAHPFDLEVVLGLLLGQRELLLQFGAVELLLVRRLLTGNLHLLLGFLARELLLMPGAGHYFHGRINELRDALVEFMRRTFPAA